MKQFRFLTMAALIAFGTAVCAQNVITLDEMQARKKQQQQQPQQQQVVQEKVSYSSASDNEAFGTFFLQYNPTWMYSKMSSGSYSASNTELIHGFSLGYIESIPLGDIPLYIEFGGAVQYFFKSKTQKGYDYDYDDYDWDEYLYDDFGGSSNHKQKFTMLSLKIPVDVMYSFDVSDGFSIQPYAGIYTRINIIGKEKIGDESINIFSKDDMGDDGAYNRFQVGLQAGCKFRIGQKFTAGIGYYRDIAPKLFNYSEHGAKSSVIFHGLDITLGLNF